MNLFSKILMAVAVVMILVTGIYANRLKNKERDHRLEQIRADSIVALNDTLKQFQAMDKATIRMLGDSLHVVERAVAQGFIARGLAPGVRTSTLSASGTIKPGMFEVVNVPAEGDTLKRFTYTQHIIPINLALQGAYRTDKNTVELRAQVNVDPVSIRVDMICRPKAVNGIRSADAFVAGPTWLTITNVSTTQRPEICNSEATKKQQPWFRPRLIAGLGWSWQESNSGPAAFVGIGLGIPLTR